LQRIIVLIVKQSEKDAMRIQIHHDPFHFHDHRFCTDTLVPCASYFLRATATGCAACSASTRVYNLFQISIFYIFKVHNHRTRARLAVMRFSRGARILIYSVAHALIKSLQPAEPFEPRDWCQVA
jgi:hypothetical protein